MTVAISYQSHPRPTGTSGPVVKDAWFVTASHPSLSNLCCGPTATGALSALLTTCSGRYVVTFPPSHSRFAFSCLGEVSNAPQDHSATVSRAAQRAEWSCSGRCHAPLFHQPSSRFPLVVPRACPALLDESQSRPPIVAALAAPLPQKTLDHSVNIEPIRA